MFRHDLIVGECKGLESFLGQREGSRMRTAQHSTILYVANGNPNGRFTGAVHHDIAIGDQTSGPRFPERLAKLAHIRPLGVRL